MAETKRSPTLYVIPAGTRVAFCRGPDCGARIWFVRTDNGRVVPVSIDCEGGKAPSESKDLGQLDMLSGKDAPVYDGAGCSHFLQCPNADDFSRSAR
jgi:hypothetical protein